MGSELCLASQALAVLPFLCLGTGGLLEPLCFQPGARAGGESFVNSECDENCCICPKARKPITGESRIKAFRNNLSLSTSAHHHLEGQALLPQPPPCPVLLASNQEKLDWGAGGRGVPQLSVLGYFLEAPP